MIPKLGGWEIVVILVVVLIIFGPKNLPKLGSAIGRTVKNLREGMDSKSDKGNEAETVEAQASNDEDAPTVVESTPSAVEEDPLHKD